MRPTEYDADTIIQAGKDLQTAGRNITGFALRQRVGGGAPSRLRQVWEDYIASQTGVVAEPVAELPLEVADEVASFSLALTERLKVLAATLNAKAIRAADRRVSEITLRASERQAEVEREIADAAQTVDDLESKIEALGQELLAQRERADMALATNQAQAVELAQLQERLRITEHAAQAATADHEQILTGLSTRLTQAEHERAAAREEAAQLRGQVSALQAQTAALTQALGVRSSNSSS